MPKELKRLIRIRLPEDLVRAVEEMGADCRQGEIPLPRSLYNMIEVSLLWAVWQHSRGRGPDTMMQSDRGFAKWNENIRDRRREVQELEDLYKLGDLQTVPGQQKQKRRD